MKELKIDEELQELFPALSEQEYEKLEQSIVTKGFDKRFPIVVWHGFIADGHNRYSVCRKHNIDFVTEELDCETKDEVIDWMMDIQMSRRNLSKVQKIIAVEKYRPVYERLAKEKQLSGLIQNQKSVTQNLVERNIQDSVTPNLAERETRQNRSENETNVKLAKIAGVGKETYRQAVVVLNSDNGELKELMISGEKSISFCYKKLQFLSRKEIQEKKNVIEPVRVQDKKSNVVEKVMVPTVAETKVENPSGKHELKPVEELVFELSQETGLRKGTELDWFKQLSMKYLSLVHENLITTSSRTYAENVTKILNKTVMLLQEIEKKYNPKPKNTGYVPRSRKGADAVTGEIFKEEIILKREEIDVTDKYPWLQGSPDNLHWDNDDSGYISDEVSEQSKYEYLNGLENVNPEH